MKIGPRLHPGADGIPGGPPTGRIFQRPYIVEGPLSGIEFGILPDSHEFGRTFEQSATELINSPQYQSWPIEGPSSRFASLRAAAIQEEIQRYKELAKEQYKATTAKGQLIMAEQAELELDRGEKNYMRRYGGEQQAQPSGAQPWSITPR